MSMILLKSYGQPEFAHKFFRSSKYFMGTPSDTHLHNPDLNWAILPPDLRPAKQKTKLKRSVKPNLAKRSHVDVETKFKELESKEKSGKDGDSDKDAQDDTDDEGEEDRKSVENVSGGEEPDEEMDGGTDYASNYFDNGEGYEDGEDDNLDEGGIY